MNERTGIAVAGTLLVDKLYEIDAYPAAGELTKIKSISLSVGDIGGCLWSARLGVYCTHRAYDSKCFSLAADRRRCRIGSRRLIYVVCISGTRIGY